ncbi:hypothetical protein AB205_0189740 [Aquarana catesbeiana]|uniref:Uncharacterized protein n=1 Tax=Aquarana catesbeiana TaxID=8400 RepID=A0A2G9S615_AQUCT|nr:hypothetical protein AB205_0189740 [Aquarana catesbeiana]
MQAAKSREVTRLRKVSSADNMTKSTRNAMKQIFIDKSCTKHFLQLYRKVLLSLSKSCSTFLLKALTLDIIQFCGKSTLKR